MHTREELERRISKLEFELNVKENEIGELADERREIDWTIAAVGDDIDEIEEELGELLDELDSLEDEEDSEC